MALSFPEKQSWISALESVIQVHNIKRKEVDVDQPVRYQGSTLLHLNRAEELDLNCCLQLSPEVQFSSWVSLLIVHLIEFYLGSHKLNQQK
jgi:citron Rho-interacting kinase